MYLPSRSDGNALPSPRLSRAGSVSSERPSLASSAVLPLPFSANPPPAYVAVAAASQMVTDYHNAQLRAQFGSDASPSPMEDGALFSEEALTLLNAFLDYLLLSFLSVAQSSSLSALKSAVVDVLKAKLAREAIASAEEELQDLSDGGEDGEEAVAIQNGTNKPGEWNLELTWKRTRLRIMVYTRWGEMEDEDEELYLGQDEIFQGDVEDNEDGETAQEKGLVSWAAAIFLTAVIEYLAEQTLAAAGQAAYTRVSAKRRSRNGPGSPATPSTQPAERVVVEEYDAEKVALNPALGRLWRTWKKQLRSIMSPDVHTPTRELKSLTLLPLTHHAQRKSSASTLNGSARGATSPRPASAAEVPGDEPSETEVAANIPIPTPANDVAEIEVPGLAREIDKQDSGASTPTVRPPQRPASVLHPSSSQSFQAGEAAPPLRRLRSNSVPVRDPKPMENPADEDANERVFATPMETRPERKSSVDEAKGPEDAAERGVAAGVLAGATSLVATAIASVVGVRKSEEGSSDHKNEQPDGPKPRTSTTDDDEKAEVLDSKRVSMGVPPTPPEVVRNTSRHSSQSSGFSSQGFPIHERPIDEPAQAQGVDNDIEDPEAIGVARTSNVPVPAPRSPTPESSKSPFVVGAFPSDEGNVGESPAKNEKRSPRRYSVSPPLSPVDTVRSFDSAPASSVKSRARPQSPSSQTSSLAPLQDVRDASGRAHYDEARASQEGYDGLPHDVYVIGQPLTISSIPEKSSKRRFRNSAASGGSSVGSIQTSNLDKPAGPHPLSSRYSPDSMSSFATPSQDRASHLQPGAGLKAQTTNTEAASVFQEPELNLSSLGEDVVQYPLESEVAHESKSSIPPLRVNKPESTKSAVSPAVNSPVVTGSSSNISSTPSTFPARSSSRSALTGKAPAGVVPSKNTSKFSSFRPQPVRASSSKSGLEAREPRIQTESMRDFADFIRSTGPDRELLTARPFPSISTSEVDMTGAAQGSSISSGDRELFGVSSSKSQPNLRPNEDAAPPTTSARRNFNLEPRGGAAATKSETADLIDFIRQGPPGPSDGRHRISRTVAPFRTTMDSDQLEQLAAEQNPGVRPNMSQANSTASKHSAPASANSRTNLVGASTTAQITFPSQPQRLAVPGGEPQMVHKRYRVKDPYAIDTDDEDENEDMLTALPKSRGRQEESLIDFLRNVEPPAEKNTPKPVLGVPSATRPAGSTKDKRNGKAVSNGSTKTGDPLPTHPAVISSNVSGGSAPLPKNMRRNIEARDARTDPTGTYQSTNDLADFLRSSGPPEPAAAPAPAPPGVVRKPEGKKGGKFWRRKTYLDMP